jgi:hypothetical protein
LVERSLRELAETRRRMDSGLKGEQIPEEPQPVRASKFVNPPPAVAPTWFQDRQVEAPTWFQDRQVETGVLARYVTDPGIRMVTVVGRGGIGKTAMVCRLLKLFESGRISDVEGDLADFPVGAIVYLSRNGLHQVDYSTFVGDLLHLVSADEVRRLQSPYQDPHHTPAQVMGAVLEAFPLGEPVVVLLDNLESVMDTEHETLTEESLEEALRVLLTAPAHAVTVIPPRASNRPRCSWSSPPANASCVWTKAWAPRTPKTCCGTSTTMASSASATPPMNCSTGYAATPAVIRGRWRRSRQSWMVTTRSPRRTSSTAPGISLETGSWRCWSGRPTSCWTLQGDR